MNKKFGYFLIALSVIVALILFFNPGIIVDYSSYDSVRQPLGTGDVILRVSMVIFVLFSTSRFGYFLVTRKN